MNGVLLVAGAIVLSTILCGLVRFLPLRDAPDGVRKHQSAPVPTAGGLGILLATALTLFIVAVQGELVSGGTIGMAVDDGVILLVLAPWVIGFFDDWRGMPAIVKLCLMSAWALAAAWVLMPSGDLVGALIAVLVFGWLIVITNASNFMDGSNGLALGSLGIMCVGLFPLYAILLFCLGDCKPHPHDEAALLTQLILFGAVCGFLVWNMRGVLYAGDTGSIGLGGLFGLMAALHFGATSDGYRTIFYVVTISLPFLVDVLLTLAWRTMKGRNLMVAHTDHAYQRLRARGWTHTRTAVVWWGMTLLCVVAAAVVLFIETDNISQRNTFPTLQASVCVALAVIGTLMWLRERSASLSTPG